MTARSRVHWAVTLLTGMVGLTVYAASDDLLVSLLLALALGWSALVATLLLLARRRAGYLVAGAAAAGLLAFELIDWNILGFRWLHAFYAVIAVLILVGVVCLEIGPYPEHLHRRPPQRPAHARR
jgi:peptidoglycan/LPS O-acetylase OafA/YrhL